MELSAIVADFVRLFFMFFTCSPNTPLRLRDECLIDQSPSHQNDEVTTSCYLTERLYPIDGQCYEIMTKGPCKENQFFFPDPEDPDHGSCDCQNNFKNASVLLYSANTDECYLQNTQGPCEVGEWFVLKDSIPQCEAVPEGCEADGKHVYWSPNDYEDLDYQTEKQCYSLNTQGPCPLGEILQRFISNDIGCQIIGSKMYLKPPNEVEEEVDPRTISLAAYRACAPGSKRAQNGKCRPVF